MHWRNEKTGVTVDVKSELGGDWKPVETKAEKTTKAPKKKTEKAKK